MKSLNRHETFQLYEHRLDSANEVWHSPFGGEPFACLLAILNTSLVADETGRNSLATSILDRGCRSCSAWGTRSDEFICDSFYRIHHDRFENGDVPEEKMVAGAWSSNPDPRDAVDAFFLTSDFGDLVFRNFLIIGLGRNVEREQALRASIDTELANAREFTEELPEPYLREYIRRLRESQGWSNK